MKAKRLPFARLAFGALLLASSALALCAPRAASAQQFDSLKCYSVIGRTQWQATADAASLLDLHPLHDPPFQAELGCALARVRPVKVCVPAESAPIFEPSGPSLSNLYTCYRVRCAGQTRLPLETENEFGQGTLTVNRTRGGSRTLCVPAA